MKEIIKRILYAIIGTIIGIFLGMLVGILLISIIGMLGFVFNYKIDVDIIEYFALWGGRVGGILGLIIGVSNTKKEA